MRLDADDLADILASIRDEGAAVVWETKSKTAKDPNKPWQGGTSTPAEHEAWICFVDMATAAALISQWGKNADLSSDVLFGLMGNHSFAPAIGDRVMRTGKEDLIVKDITEAAPAGIPLFYVLEFNA